jgi:hypothetical protein
LRLVNIKSEPALANASAVARPMPLLAPVTIVTFLSSENCFKFGILKILPNFFDSNHQHTL